MKCRWTKESVKWYLAAEKSTGFYKNMVSIMEPFLEGTNTALDIGCGIGSLALELGRRGLKVTAVDVSSLAVSVTRDRAAREGLNNVKALNLSYDRIDRNQKYGVVVLCYVMGLLEQDHLSNILGYAEKHLIIVVPEEEMKDDFSILSLARAAGIDEGNFRQVCCKDVLKLLDKMDIRYRIYPLKEQFGQPFDSLQEALDFFKHYFPVLAENEKRLKKWLSGRLRTEQKGCYLPSTRKSAVIIISMEGVE